MTQQKSLAQFFKELGNNPAQLAAFQSEPSQLLNTLSEPELDKLLKISEQLIHSTNDDESSDLMPDFTPIIPGDFYTGADEGSTIYQLYTTQNLPPMPSSSLSQFERLQNNEESRIHVAPEPSVIGVNENPYIMDSPTPIHAIKHFFSDDEDSSFSRWEYYRVTMETLSFKVEASPMDKYLLTAKISKDDKSSSKITLSIQASDDDTAVKVSGENVKPESLACDSTLQNYTIKKQHRKKPGYILLTAPASIHKLTFTPESS